MRELLELLEHDARRPVGELASMLGMTASVNVTGEKAGGAANTPRRTRRSSRTST